jgi:protein-S-isoprenylcysteine O-methyltransferase Ste14
MTAQTKQTNVKVIVQLLIVLVLVPFMPLIASGAWGWWQAWAYALLAILGFIISRALAVRRNPDIIKERSDSFGKEDAKPWDKILAPTVALGSVVPLFLIGLDKRFGWTTPFGLSANLIALIVIIVGYAVGSWALIENRFFSGVVRIQTDRGHHVVNTGPYRLVRHPGYAASLWTYLATPILLDSLWALLPTLLLVAAMVLRTLLEDRTLQAELPGYADYAKQTRYRLLPRIW